MALHGGVDDFAKTCTVTTVKVYFSKGLYLHVKGVPFTRERVKCLYPSVITFFEGKTVMTIIKFTDDNN